MTNSLCTLVVHRFGYRFFHICPFHCFQFLAFNGGISSKSLLSFINFFKSWGIYTCLVSVFVFVGINIVIERRPERVERLKWFFPYKFSIRTLLFGGFAAQSNDLLIMNLVGLGICSCATLVIIASSLGKKPKASLGLLLNLGFV